MSPLETEILALRDCLEALPASVERTLAIRAISHARSLLSRDLVSAADAFYRAKRFYEQAPQDVRRSA